MSIQKTYDKLVEEVNDMASDIEKVEESSVRAAGKRVRKGCQAIKALAQELRIDVMDVIRK